ncbi:BC1881 family protein [Paenibacillus sp. EKM206P]|uniref:BC1881 family protein n=1 Tax=Paenibacillus sp. EKM206P TaxID=1683674 RepID=UPI0013EB61D8|nr:BC1881 family protein [Paenibacillus sp. EKM206P]KAF6569083.1 BC1881 family protein [Paenibacillus sp. EKM206P]
MALSQKGPGLFVKLHIPNRDIPNAIHEEGQVMPNANIVDHIGSKVTVWTKDGNAAEKRTLHTVDEFGVVISNQYGQQTFIPWIQVKYIDYPNTSPESVAKVGNCIRKLSNEEFEEFKRMWKTSGELTAALDLQTGRRKILKDISTKELSDELRSRAGVQVLEISPEDTLNAMTLRSGRYQSVTDFSGPAVVLINQD